LAAYWLLFFILGSGAVIYARVQLATTDPGNSVAFLQSNRLLNGALLLVLLMMGLRYEVGGDWATYLRIFHWLEGRSLQGAFEASTQEFGYTLINWLVDKAGLDIWGVNLLCAIPFVFGLSRICKQQPNPWLAMAVAAPLFIVVVGMGYTRQAAAAGCLMIGMAKLTQGGSYAKFAFWTLVGCLFHQSVMIFVPVVGLFLVRARLGSLLLAVAAVVIAYYVVLPSVVERYSAGYIEAVYKSQGAIIRIALNGVAGLILLAFPNNFYANYHEKRVWRAWALLSLACIPAYLIVASSVIVDRLALYLIPLQIYVFSRIPRAISRGRSMSVAWTALIVAFFGVVLFVWLIYANNARFWLPYRLFPFD
jgi:hypothetical protein